jgi:hypothetical protein
MKKDVDMLTCSTCAQFAWQEWEYIVDTVAHVMLGNVDTFMMYCSLESAYTFEIFP